MAPISLETANLEELKTGFGGIGDSRAKTLIALRSAAGCLTFAMVEAVRDNSLTSDEKAHFVEWLGTKGQGSGAGGAVGPIAGAPVLRGHPKDRPKDCAFDGKASWVGFRRKFESYRNILGWSEDQAKDFLEWSMIGAAQDFFCMKLGAGGKSLDEMMGVLEQRYGVNELEDSARARLETSYQREEEPLEEWADRVQTMTIAAYRNCPETFAMKEAVMRFCRGVRDIEAGKFVLLGGPKSIEEAVNGVRKYQHEARVARDSRQSREVVAVKEVKEESQVLAQLLEVMTGMKKCLDNQERRYQGSWRGRGRGRGGYSGQGGGEYSRVNPNIVCYACDQMGHIARNCPRLAQGQVNETGAQALNWAGPGGEGQPSGPPQ